MLDTLLLTRFPADFWASVSLSEASEDREVEERDREGVSAGVAEMEFEEDEGVESATGLCKTLLREIALVDMLEKKPR